MKVNTSNHPSIVVSAASLQPWQEPAVAFERILSAEGQDGIGPRNGPPSGLLGPLSTSGTTITPATC